MDSALRSSDIRELVADEELSDVSVSDLEADNFPDDVSLEDFSSGSDEVYVPNQDDVDTSDDENQRIDVSGNNNYSGVHRECFPYLEHYWRPLRPGRKRKKEDGSDTDQNVIKTG
ncbi:hypothetical protein J6590_107861, partial [Homalodisca vitripennis]